LFYTSIIHYGIIGAHKNFIWTDCG